RAATTDIYSLSLHDALPIYRVFVDKRPDDARIEGIRMKNDADAGGRGQTKRPRKSERVKERKNSHDAVFRMEHENLIELLHVRSNIVMREDHALRLAGRAAGKYNCGDVIKRRSAIAAREFREGLCRQKAGS